MSIVLSSSHSAGPVMDIRDAAQDEVLGCDDREHHSVIVRSPIQLSLLYYQQRTESLEEFYREFSRKTIDLNVLTFGQVLEFLQALPANMKGHIRVLAITMDVAKALFLYLQDELLQGLQLKELRLVAIAAKSVTNVASDEPEQLVVDFARICTTIAKLNFTDMLVMELDTALTDPTEPIYVDRLGKVISGARSGSVERIIEVEPYPLTENKLSGILLHTLLYRTLEHSAARRERINVAECVYLMRNEDYEVGHNSATHPGIGQRSFAQPCATTICMDLKGKAKVEEHTGDSSSPTDTENTTDVARNSVIVTQNSNLTDNTMTIQAISPSFVKANNKRHRGTDTATNAPEDIQSIGEKPVSKCVECHMDRIIVSMEERLCWMCDSDHRIKKARLASEMQEVEMELMLEGKTLAGRV